MAKLLDDDRGAITTADAWVQLRFRLGLVLVLFGLLEVIVLWL